ncbi:hypothetical protein ASPWEDRAFT_168659 [Aspergillus wentii DTO 134E9]|uniref:F-box domain-containing protein n=1 Tax=Aspergillus wentii DTO 134E9 TaxID=1073089 RepID=A0A1L9RV66_ASPWE|nr:uncharacterized protein ASPWEDRAFT_168659 [Aspergillus wentii DTO 134E9]OJJ38773.1 hypothetical protein ASPWEDRAFT_168659 [Aspergillus wentii DTO 134E9]
MTSEGGSSRSTLLKRLPEELLEMIANRIASADVPNLALSCKTFHRLLTSRLYEDLILVPSRDGTFYQFANRSQRTYFTEDGAPIKISPWKFLKSLEFRALSQTTDRRTCALEYGDWLDNYLDPTLKENFILRHRTHRFEFLSWVSGKIKDVFGHIKPNTLSGFRWHLGCCVPNSILGTSGYIPRHQERITSLSLDIDGSCRHAPSYEGLLQLKQLCEFSWQNFNPEGNDLVIFRSVLRNNSNHLITLGVKGPSFLWPTLKGLGLVSSDEDESIEYEYAEDEDPENIELHSLQHLSLSQVDIGSLNEIYDFSFDLTKLRSLRLGSCGNVPDLFRAIQLRAVVNLRTLHFINTNDDDDTCPSVLDALISFLESFSGLEELFILSIYLSSRHSDSLVATEPFQSHKMKLKRLLCQPIYHYDGQRDSYVHDSPLMFLSQLKHLEALECLGAWVSPGYVKQQIRSSRISRSIKLIHFRMEGTYYLLQDVVKELVKSGYPTDLLPPSIHTRDQQAPKPDDSNEAERAPKIPESHFLPKLFQFAKWAFRPEGLPSLQVLAYGDFANNDQKWTRLLLCRHDPNVSLDSGGASDDLPFRLVHPENQRCLGGIERGRELLHEFSAAPPVYKRGSF